MCRIKVNNFHRVCAAPSRQLAGTSAPAHARNLAWEVTFPLTILAFGWVPAREGLLPASRCTSFSLNNIRHSVPCRIQELGAAENAGVRESAQPGSNACHRPLQGDALSSSVWLSIPFATADFARRGLNQHQRDVIDYLEGARQLPRQQRK